MALTVIQAKYTKEYLERYADDIINGQGKTLTDLLAWGYKSDEDKRAELLMYLKGIKIKEQDKLDRQPANKIRYEAKLTELEEV